MRYIGRASSSLSIQIDPDANSYVNIKTFGAAGLDQYFEARVRGAGGSGGTTIEIGDIPNYSAYEKDYFKVGQELYAYFYLDTSTPPVVDYDGIFTNLSITTQGNVIQSGTTTSRALQYFVYPFNPRTGRLSPYRKTFLLADVYKNPSTQFDAENYVKLNFTRVTSDWLPIIFRQWGNSNIEFVGIPSNSIFSDNTAVTFNDRGQTEIPSWDQGLLASNEFFPEFLNGILTYSSDTVTSKTIVIKRRLRITSRQLSGILECVDADTDNGSFNDLDNLSMRVRFRFDDTKAVQDAVNFAAVNNLKDVFIPSGVYSVRNVRFYGSTIQARQYSGIVLRGSGEGSVIKKMGTAVNPQGQYGILGLLGSGISNRINGATFSNMSFDGNKTETFPLNVPENDVYGIGDKYNDMIAMEYVDSVRITDCSFYNGAGSAFYALDADKITFTGSRIYQLSKPFELNISPIKIRESSRVIAQGNLFENCSGPADLTGVDASVINNNIINNCGDTGLQLRASDTWNAQGNLTFNESGSLVRSIDLYQNDYSRASLDIKKGLVMNPIFFTVTDGGFPVNISPGSIVARVYPLNSTYNYNTVATATYLQVLESNPQLEAGIFSVTAPVSTLTGVGGSNQGKNILGTNSYELIDIANSRYGYGYRITATVSVGKYPIQQIAYNSPTSIKIFLRTSSDILSLLFFTSGNGSNDSIKTTGVGVPQTSLANWPDGSTLDILSIDTANAGIVISTPSGVASEFNDVSTLYNTPAGNLSIVKNNYFIADGNVYVSE